jgi:hypothetical protein
MTHIEMCSFLHGSTFPQCLRYRRGSPAVDPKLGENECPPVAYSGLVDQELVQEPQKVWVRLEEIARGASGELKLHCG